MNQNKYKIGDIVRIKSDLNQFDDYQGYSLNSAMCAFIGKNVTITEVNDFIYRIQETKGASWTDSMIECLVQPALTANTPIIKGEDGFDYVEVEQEIDYTEDERLELLDSLEEEQEIPPRKKIKIRVKVEKPKLEIKKLSDMSSGPVRGTVVKCTRDHTHTGNSRRKYHSGEFYAFIRRHPSSNEHFQFEEDRSPDLWTNTGQYFTIATQEEFDAYNEKIKSDPSRQVLEKDKAKEILWDIILKKYGAENCDRQADTTNRINFIVRYPKFIISNSNKFSKELRDLFFKIEMEWYSDRWILICMIGARTTFEYVDYVKAYQHSHLSHGDNCGTWADCCLGSGTPISIKQAELRDDGIRTVADLENFELFFFLLDSYIEWESLEGGPYIKMEGIKLPTAVNYDSSLLRNKTDEFYKKVKSLPIKLIERGDINCLEVNRPSLEKYIKESEVYNVCIKQPNGSYVDINQSGNGSKALVDSVMDRKPMSEIIFQGKRLPITVYLKDAKEVEEIDKDSLFPPVALVDVILYDLTRKIQTFNSKFNKTIKSQLKEKEVL